MNEDVYRRLAQTLDTLPSGFPSTEDGAEIAVLKTLFTPEEAELFCELRLTFETAEEVALRTGRPLEGLEDALAEMWRKGLLRGIDSGKEKRFKMVPWIVGIYEYQYNNPNEEFWKKNRKYAFPYVKQLYSKTPQATKILPVEATMGDGTSVMPYDRISSIIENSKSFLKIDCICRKERSMVGKGCDHPMGVCMLVSDDADEFNERSPWAGERITKEQAYKLARESEETGLVHNTSNSQSGHTFICSCCGCSCGTLNLLKKSIIPASELVNSPYYAEIDPDLCEGCELCVKTRCQVNAIKKEGDVCRVDRKICIGCGLCASTCPTKAAKLIRKSGGEEAVTPVDEAHWSDERAHARGKDYTQYK